MAWTLKLLVLFFTCFVSNSQPSIELNQMRNATLCQNNFSFPLAKKAHLNLLTIRLWGQQPWRPMTRQSTRVFIASDWLPVGISDPDRPANLRQMTWRLVSSGCNICESFSSQLHAFVLSTWENCSVCAVSIISHWDKCKTRNKTPTFLRKGILHAAVNQHLNVLCHYVPIFGKWFSKAQCEHAVISDLVWEVWYTYWIHKSKKFDSFHFSTRKKTPLSASTHSPTEQDFNLSLFSS